MLWTRATFRGPPCVSAFGAVNDNKLEKSRIQIYKLYHCSQLTGHVTVPSVNLHTHTTHKNKPHTHTHAPHTHTPHTHTRTTHTHTTHTHTHTLLQEDTPAISRLSKQTDKKTYSRLSSNWVQINHCIKTVKAITYPPTQYLTSYPIIIKEIGWIQINDSPLWMVTLFTMLRSGKRNDTFPGQ